MEVRQRRPKREAHHIDDGILFAMAIRVIESQISRLRLIRECGK